MLLLVGVGLTGLSLLFNIIGLAIPYWVYGSVGSLSSHIGLWQACTPVSTETVCFSIGNDDIDTAFRATRAMELMGMMTIAAAFACAILKQFAMKDRQILPKIGAVFSIVAGVLMIIGCVIFATSEGIDVSTLHAGFGLCVVAGALGIIGGIILFLAARNG